MKTGPGDNWQASGPNSSASSKAQCIPLESVGGTPSYVNLLNEFLGPMTAMFVIKKRILV